MLERLLDVAPDYSWTARVHLVEGGAVVDGHLTIGDKTAYGVGAMKNSDIDMAVKSANSEAMKNAAKNGFGVGLELWDEEYRKTLDTRRQLASGSEAALKRAVMQLAREKTGLDRPGPKQVAEVFGRKTGELADADVLRSILEDEGLL
jgi:hypothetical protein